MHPLKTTLLIITLLLAGCTETPDEDQIRQNLDATVAAVKARKPKEVVEHLAEDFLGQERMTVDQVRKFMIAQFFRNQSINVVITGLKIEVRGDRADVQFRAILAGGLNWLPERLDYYQVRTSWVKQDGDWRIHRASWEPVLLD